LFLRTIKKSKSIIYPNFIAVSVSLVLSTLISPRPFFEVTICDLKSSSSFSFNCVSIPTTNEDILGKSFVYRKDPLFEVKAQNGVVKKIKSKQSIYGSAWRKGMAQNGKITFFMLRVSICRIRIWEASSIPHPVVICTRSKLDDGSYPRNTAIWTLSIVRVASVSIAYFAVTSFSSPNNRTGTMISLPSDLKWYLIK